MIFVVKKTKLKQGIITVTTHALQNAEKNLNVKIKQWQSEIDFLPVNRITGY